MKTLSKERIEWIDIAKGIGIILVVIGHMFRGFTSAGMYKQYDGILKYIDYTIYSFHMPLFFIISGFLYKRKFKIDTYKCYFKFIRSKIYSLMIPYFIFSWIQILIKLIMANSVNYKVNISDFFGIIINPIEQFWFLYSLTIIFIIMSFLDFKISNEIIKFGIVLIIGLVVSASYVDLGIVGNALYNMIYFYIGRYLIKMMNKREPNNFKLVTGIFMMYSLMNIYFYHKYDNVIIKIIMAVSASVVLIYFCSRESIIKNKVVKIMKTCGKYSMTIYLLHTIFGSGIRIILVKIGIDSFFVQCTLGLIFGILIPIILENIYRFGLRKFISDKE